MTRFEAADTALLPGFLRRRVEIAGKEIMTVSAGKGPPLLLLHGDPQTHLCWHEIAPRFTDRFTVILTDLRGRGESHKPGPSSDSLAYAKREMAAEQLAVMRALGHERFSLVGHDRGARVARRLALDHPDAVAQLAVMDIVPALDFYEQATARIAQDYFYFFFLTQAYPLPERLIQGDAVAFMRQILLGLSDRPVAYAEMALDLYLRASTTPEAVTAMCECFRAGFRIDREHDRADRALGRKIVCPTLVMWGRQGVVGTHFDLRRIWAAWCEEATFIPLPSGHFIPEEAPDAAFAALDGFLR
ncbi:MAG: alpha/beta hydrolase [Rhodospirillales bacterium]